jgi:uncharacterized membrane protein YfcA
MEIFVYACIGAITGLFAGLLGIGGGSLFVPLYIIAFRFFDMPHAVIVHMAVATSLAAMILMEATATYVHYRQDSVAWRLVLYLAPTIALGALTGAELAEHLQAQWLLLIIILFQVYVATYLLRTNRQPEHRDASDNRLPKKIWLAPIGFGIGAFAAIIGIGGGKLLVPYFVWSRLPTRVAISTAPPIGFFLASTATLSYLFESNPLVEQMPNPHMGLVYWHALLGSLPPSLLFTYIGAKLVHVIPGKPLKLILALGLYALAIQMTFDLL